MDSAGLLLEAFGRIRALVPRIVDGLDSEQLAWRPQDQGNSIGWFGFDFLGAGNGLRVTTAIDGTSAAKAGFGSEPALVTSIDGHDVGTRDDYCKAVQDAQSGDTATVSGVTKTGNFFNVKLTYE